MAIFKGGIFTKRRELDSFFVNSYGNAQTRGVYTFTIDVETGEIFFKSHFKTPTNPIYSFNYGRFVCTTYKNRTGALSDGGVCSYTSTAQTLSLVSRVTDEGKTYMHGCVNGDDVSADKFFGVDYYNGEIMVARIVKKKLNKVIYVHKLEGVGVDPIRQTQSHPHYVGFTPDNQLYVVDLGLDRVIVFDVQEDGTLVEDVDVSFDVTPGYGPRQMTFNKEGTIAYVVNELVNTICVYHYENKTFTFMQEIDSYDKEKFPEEDNLVSEFKLTEDGLLAVVLNRGHDSVTLFSINEDGSLTYQDFVDTSANPRCLEIFRDRWIVVGCQKGGIIEVVEISREKNGLLFERDYSYLIAEPVCINEFFDILERKGTTNNSGV